MIALRSDRLVLDAPRDSDIAAVFDACQDPEIRRWIPLPDPYTIESAEFFVRSYCPHGLASDAFTVWAIRTGDDLPLLGVIEVRKDEAPGSASIGCWLARGARGSGVMHEGLGLVISNVLTGERPGLDRLRWETLADNGVSRRVAESVGFAFDGEEHEVDFRGERRSAVVGTLTSAL